MGFLDNLVRSIEDGGFEKVVANTVDGLETKLNKVVEKVDQAAAKLDTSKSSAKVDSEQ